MSDPKTAPTGCLGCNRAAIETFLKSHGMNPDEFKEVMKPDHITTDIAVCRRCDKAWLIPKMKKKGHA